MVYMPMFTQGYDTEPITPAESVRHDWQVEENKLSRQHDLRVREMELEVMEKQNNLSTWFQIPKMILLLPLLILLGVGYIVAMIRGIEPGDRFWDIIRGL